MRQCAALPRSVTIRYNTCWPTRGLALACLDRLEPARICPVPEIPYVWPAKAGACRWRTSPGRPASASSISTPWSATTSAPCPATSTTRGFLRNYGSYLGLNTAEVIAAYDGRNDPPRKRPRTRPIATQTARQAAAPPRRKPEQARIQPLSPTPVDMRVRYAPSVWLMSLVAFVLLIVVYLGYNAYSGASRQALPTPTPPLAPADAHRAKRVPAHRPRRQHAHLDNPAHAERGPRRRRSRHGPARHHRHGARRGHARRQRRRGRPGRRPHHVARPRRHAGRRGHCRGQRGQPERLDARGYRRQAPVRGHAGRRRQPHLDGAKHDPHPLRPRRHHLRQRQRRGQGPRRRIRRRRSSRKSGTPPATSG